MIDVMQIDLKSLKSVRQFAAAFMAKYHKLDLLINNAGIMAPSYSKTEDGFEGQMAANYFGHFLLTGLLLPLLKKNQSARIIMLSSLAHAYGKIDFKNLNSEKHYSKIGAYSASKLACLMFALQLQRKFDVCRLPCIALAAHPGVSVTALFKHMPGWLHKIVLAFMSTVSQPADKGALPVLMAALQPGLHGGEYFGPTKKREMKGPPGPAKISSKALDEDVAKKLWQRSEELVNFTYDFS